MDAGSLRVTWNGKATSLRVSRAQKKDDGTWLIHGKHDYNDPCHRLVWRGYNQARANLLFRWYITAKRNIQDHGGNNNNTTTATVKDDGSCCLQSVMNGMVTDIPEPVAEARVHSIMWPASNI